ncbi:MAG: hypothetical protein J5U19_07210 [Candidatus Methanoperedens sp.]|nr:hypothetical protein [Candidatus Methanoperedens sp.]
MSNKLKIGLLILTVAAMVLVPETSALPSYAAVGGVPCGTCHVNSSGGGTLNEVGINFSKQANHASDPKAALISIGVLSTSAAVTTNLTNNITDVNETNENETNATEIANEEGNAIVMPVNTTVEPATPEETTIEPTIPVSTPKPSPGFGIVMAIGIVLSIIYLFGKRR